MDYKVSVKKLTDIADKCVARARNAKINRLQGRHDYFIRRAEHYRAKAVAIIIENSL